MGIASEAHVAHLWVAFTTRALKSKLNIMSLPTTMIFRGGQQVSRLAGATTKDELVEWINASLALSDIRLHR
jgi:thioredoxin-like negative regulator of GroEL